MKISAFVAVMTMALVAAFVTLRTPAAPSSASVLVADTFNVDPVHSSIIFKIRHMGVSNFYGRFNDYAGEFRFDPSDLAAAHFDITVQATSVDTGNAGRDGHLRKPDFFTVDSFTAISFKSTGVTAGAKKGMYELKGDLTMVGETRPITASLEWFGEIDGGERLGVIAGFEAIFTIKRSDFGMDYGVDQGALGDDVTLVVAIEGKKAPAAQPAE